MPRTSCSSRRLVLLVGHRQVVPLDLALHEGDALAEDRAARPARAAAPASRSSARIVSASATGSWPSTSCTSQPNARQRSADRREVEHVLRVAERLLAVDVDDRDEVRQPVVRGEHHGLPDRALVALGVAEQARTRAAPSAEGAPASAAPAASERPCPSEPVEKSIPRDPGLRVRRRAACRPRSRSRARRASASRGVERGVEGEARVALREDEPVAVGVARVARRRGRLRRAPRRCPRRRAPSRCGRRPPAWTARGRCGESPARTRARPSESRLRRGVPSIGGSTRSSCASRHWSTTYPKRPRSRMLRLERARPGLRTTARRSSRRTEGGRGSGRVARTIRGAGA